MQPEKDCIFYIFKGAENRFLCPIFAPWNLGSLDFYCAAMDGDEASIRKQAEEQQRLGPHAGCVYHDPVCFYCFAPGAGAVRAFS